MIKKRYILALAVLLIVGLSVVKVLFTTRIATDGIALSEVNQEIEAYKKENLLIREQITLKTSYAHIASEAATLGFVEEKTPVYVNTSVPVAIKP